MLVETTHDSGMPSAIDFGFLSGRRMSLSYLPKVMARCPPEVVFYDLLRCNPR